MFKKLVAIEPVSLIPTAEEALHQYAAKAIIQGSYTEGATLTVDYDGTGLVLR